MNSNSGKIWMVPLVLTGFYFWSIMPRMTKKPDMSLFRTRLYAHRGLHDNSSKAPENSMAAFRKAVEAGYGIELDVQLSADKVPVIFHDFSLQRACKVNGQVRDYTFRELRQLRLFDSDERIPSLKEFLAMVDGRVPLIVEYKSEDPDMTVCEKTDPLLRAYKGSYCIESFNPLVLYWYRKKRPGVVRGQLSDGFIYDPKYRRPDKAPGSVAFQFLLQTSCQNRILSLTIYYMKVIFPGGFAEISTKRKRRPGPSKTGNSCEKRRGILTYSSSTASYPDPMPARSSRREPVRQKTGYEVFRYFIFW